MALFDLAPKETPASLFGREAELRQLVQLVDAGRWVVVLGPRMVGKTSLVKAATRQMRRPAIYVNLWGARGSSGFVNAFVHGLNASRTLMMRVRSAVRRLDGISVGPGGLSVSAPRRPLGTIWDLLDLIGSEAGASVIALDEVQEVAAASGTILRLLANVFNTHPKVVFVFTGSQFGVVRSLLHPSADSPLYGRSPATLRLTPFDLDTAYRFVAAGLREARRPVDRPAIERALARSIGGNPGWLTLFGNELVLGRASVEEAEHRTVQEGRKVIRQELRSFLEDRNAQTYWDALRVIALGASWSDVRNALSERRGSPVNDNSVRLVLQTLLRAELVEQRERQYWIPDPMVRGCVTARSEPP